MKHGADRSHVAAVFPAEERRHLTVVSLKDLTPLERRRRPIGDEIIFVSYSMLSGKHQRRDLNFLREYITSAPQDKVPLLVDERSSGRDDLRFAREHVLPGVAQGDQGVFTDDSAHGQMSKPGLDEPTDQGLAQAACATPLIDDQDSTHAPGALGDGLGEEHESRRAVHHFLLGVCGRDLFVGAFFGAFFGKCWPFLGRLVRTL